MIEVPERGEGEEEPAGGGQAGGGLGRERAAVEQQEYDKLRARGRKNAVRQLQSALLASFER